MLIILLAIIIILLILNYFSNKDLLSPSFLLKAVFLLGTLLSILGNKNWNVSISPLLIIVVTMSLVSFYIGEKFIRNKVKIYSNDTYKGFKISSLFLFLFIILGIFILYIYLNKINTISNDFGYIGIGNRYNYFRMAMLTGNYSLGLVFSMFLLFFQGIGYIAIFNLIRGKIKSKLQKILYFIIIFLVIISMVLGSSRDGFIFLIVYIYVIYIFTKRLKTSHIILISIISILVLFLGFVALGIFTGKSNFSVFFETIYLYGGSSLVGLSEFLKKGLIQSNNFGYESFIGIRDLINRFFPNFSIGNYILEFTFFPDGTATNIYTAYRAFLVDFGWIGLILINVILGMIMSYLRMFTASKSMHRELFIVLYAYYMGQLLYMLFTPNITNGILSITQIFQLTPVFIIYIFNKRRKL